MARDLKRELKVAYCAGIIDGEGCISMRTRGNSIDYSVQVQMADIDPILVLQELYGGTVKQYKSKTKNSLPFFRWGLWANKAIYVLIDMLPYLTIKRRKAELAIKLINLGRFNRLTLTTDIKNQRAAIVLEYKSLTRQRYNNRWKEAD